MNRDEMREAGETMCGSVQWFSSEEDGGPDVGILIGLGSSKALWLGERSNKEGGGVGVLIYADDRLVENADMSDYDQMRDVLEFHVAPALASIPAVDRLVEASQTLIDFIGPKDMRVYASDAPIVALRAALSAYREGRG